MKLNEIRELCRGQDYLVIEDRFAVIADCDHRSKRVFVLVDGGEYEEIDVKGMIKRISNYLSKHITLEQLLQDKLLHEPIETILDLDMRIKKEPEVKERKGCYALLIKGKQGRPLELML